MMERHFNFKKIQLWVKPCTLKGKENINQSYFKKKKKKLTYFNFDRS